mmetsp:Transcript_37597/g.45756  ORF Transcript_37597/g.45756 Transcript_37597/m.45756 type:complete len:95 (+) Transcript_37597:906-1190(+)
MTNLTNHFISQRDSNAKTSYLHKLTHHTESGHHKMRNSSIGVVKNSFGAGFAFASSRDGSNSPHDHIGQRSKVASSFQSSTHGGMRGVETRYSE